VNGDGHGDVVIGADGKSGADGDGSPVVSGKLSPKFSHKNTKMGFLKTPTSAGTLATCASVDLPVRHRHDRVRDRREDAAEAGLHGDRTDKGRSHHASFGR
jgi:hypothetical protein